MKVRNFFAHRLHTQRSTARRSAAALTALFAAGALVLSACGTSSTQTGIGGSQSSSNSSHSSVSATPTKGGTLTVLTSQSSLSLDPATSQSLPTTTTGLVHRRLTTWKVTKGKTTVVPDLATSTGTPSQQGKVWTYHLKKGLRFSNGQPITSQDVKWGIERSFADSFTGGLSYHKQLLQGAQNYHGPFSGQQLSSIETPDDSTIIFHLNSPFGAWPWVTSLISFAPVPRGQGSQKSYGNQPVASGPYQVQSNSAGRELVLTRNKYWKASTDSIRKAYPDRIIYRMGQDDTVAAQQIMQGANGGDTSILGEFVPPAQLAQAQANPQYSQLLTTSGDGALEYLAINTRTITNRTAREAILWATDRAGYRTAAGGSIAGSYATTLITAGISGRQKYDLYHVPVGGDPAHARQLLKKAHITLPTLKMVIPQSRTEQASAIQSSLKKASINVRIQVLDSEVYSDTVTNNQGDYDLTIASWQPDFPSAYANIAPLFSSSMISGGNQNISRYSNRTVDDLITRATQTVDPAAAGKIWAQADRRIMQDIPVVPLIYSHNTFIHGSRVAGFDIGSFPAYPDYLTMGLTKD